MKKLAVLLQIAGVLAVCPMYVVLEIQHYTKVKTEVTSGSFIKSKTEIISTGDSKVPGNNTHNTPYPLIAK